MATKAGRKDRRIRIFFPVVTQNGAGETVQTFPPTHAKDTWAEVGQPYAREIVLNNVTTAVTQYNLAIRWRPGVTADCQIGYKGKTLRISQVLGENDRKRDIEIVAFEGVL